MHSTYDPAIAERKAKNRAIFAETMKICREGYYISPSGARIELPPSDEVRETSVFYINPPKADAVPARGESETDAVNADCIDVARELVAEGYSPIMLNMASRRTPGGGALNGARAQEETLFRRSNLCVSLYQYSGFHAGLLGIPTGNGRYPLDRYTGGIYTKRAMFFRAGWRDGDGLLDSPFECAVVTTPAINRPELTADGMLVEGAAAGTMGKIRSMLRIGLRHGHDAIVLGAWGCGAFRNPPRHIARLFREVLNEPEFAGKYARVRFAVIEDHNSRHMNYAPFAEVFNCGKDKDMISFPA